MKLKPLGDRLVVRRTESAEKSRGGVYLPDNAKQKPQRGTVLAVGPGKMMKDGTLSEGMQGRLERAASGEPLPGHYPLGQAPVGLWHT